MDWPVGCRRELAGERPPWGPRPAARVVWARLLRAAWVTRAWVGPKPRLAPRAKTVWLGTPGLNRRPASRSQASRLEVRAIP